MLLYIPAGLIEIHPQVKYQFATIYRSLDSTLDLIFNPQLTTIKDSYTDSHFSCASEQKFNGTRAIWKVVAKVEFLITKNKTPYIFHISVKVFISSFK